MQAGFCAPEIKNLWVRQKNCRLGKIAEDYRNEKWQNLKIIIQPHTLGPPQDIVINIWEKRTIHSSFRAFSIEGVLDYNYTGNRALLDRRKIAVFAPHAVSPAVREQALRWAEACCATDRVVISGFQSLLEKIRL